jgi:hypothetical protein
VTEIKLDTSVAVYADDVNLLGDNLDTTKKNTQTLIDTSKEVCLEADTEKTKYILLSRHQNAGQNDYIKIANRSFGNVAQFKYLGTAITNQNLIQEEIMRRFNSDNACYCSVHNLFASPLLPANINIEIQKTIISPGVLYVCETCFLTLVEERGLRMFGKIFGLKRDEWTGVGEHCIMRSFVTCTFRQVRLE